MNLRYGQESVPNQISPQLIVDDYGLLSVWPIDCRIKPKPPINKKGRISVNEANKIFWLENSVMRLCVAFCPFFWMNITLGIMMESRKNPVVHVYPDWTSPVRWVMLCVTFHVYWAVIQCNEFVFRIVKRKMIAL